MKNTFESAYIRMKTCEAAYSNATTEQEKAAAHEAHTSLVSEIMKNGEAYCTIYRIYEVSRDNGNERIDVRDCSDYRDEGALIAAFREFGITEFTFSSTWSDAVKSAFEFTKHGAKLDGMVEVDGGSKPAYLFRL